VASIRKCGNWSRAGIHPIPHRTALPPYTETEWDRLVSTCRAIVDDTYSAHKHGLAAANRGTIPTHERWTEDNLTWLLARLGPVGTPGVADYLGCSLNAVQKRRGVPDASARISRTFRS